MLKKGLLVGVVLLGLARPAPQVYAAASYTVNSFLDEADQSTGDGACRSTPSAVCTLRAAIMQANVVIGPGIDIILPAGTYTLTLLPVGGNGASTGDLNLTTPASGSPVISILGAGAATTIIDADQIDRVFRIEENRTVVMSGITIRNGLVANDGGGIWSVGNLTVTQSTIANNRGLVGGGVINVGIMHLIQSTVAGNFGTGGGGIYNADTLYVDRSTLAFNRANGNGGGLTNGAILFAENSTFTQNDADGSGGAIYNYFTANVYNLTIAFNGADADFDQDGGSGGLGGGVFNISTGTFNLRNTLMAGNILSNSPIYEDCSGTVRLFGRNMTWTTDGCTFDTTNGIRFQLNSLNTIGPLQNNGGPTWTNALLVGSNAINAGLGCVDQNSQPLATDQRGAARVIGSSCDLGAYEYRPPMALPLILR
jgi:CSLREA domain-containing protein